MWTKELSFLVPVYSFTQLLYWKLLHYPEEAHPHPVALAVKCLPILTLIIYLISRRPWPGAASTDAGLMAAGFAFSVGGDFLLHVFRSDSFFALGMASFALAQVCFIKAFGLQRDNFKPGLMAFCYALGLAYCYIVLPKIDSKLVY